MSGKKVSGFSQRFAKLLNEYVDNGGTQQELAKMLGVSRQTVSAWCNGERSPKQPAIESIANKMHINVAWLSGYDVQREPDSHDNNSNGMSAMLEDLRRSPGRRTMFSLTKNVDEKKLEEMNRVLKAMIGDDDVPE